MKFIIESPKYGRHEVLIDDEDAAGVLRHRWHVAVNNRRRAIYAGTHINNKCVTLQQYLTTYRQTDHINGNGLDCRRCNMRESTRAQNMQNRGSQKNNTSGYKGVIFLKATKKWMAQIWKDGVKEYLGVYDLKEHAAIAYNNAARRLHGEYAVLNEVLICK